MHFPSKIYTQSGVRRVQVELNPVSAIDAQLNQRGIDVVKERVRTACPLGRVGCRATISLETGAVECTLNMCPPGDSNELPPDGGDRSPKSPLVPSGTLGAKLVPELV